MVTPTQFEDIGLFSPPPANDNRSELGQDDFLTLMITQFRNQDPFEPLDNGEFLGQLAQFSTVSGIDSLNGAFASLASAFRDEQALQAANLVGRGVLAQSNTGYYDGTDALAGAVELGASATSVQIDITDAAGQLVRRIELGDQPAGRVEFTWDGRDADGDVMPTGAYGLSARVVRGSFVESVPTYVRGSVESVTLGQFGGGMTLNLAGGGTLSLADIYQII